MKSSSGTRRSRGYAAALLAFLVSGTPSAVEPGGTVYSVAEMGLIPDAHVTVPLALNNDSHVVGWGQGPGAQVRPFLWTPQDGIAEFPLPPGFTWGYATDISNSGIIVGTAYNGIGANEARAWRWVNGVHELLPPFPSSCPGMVPTAVNDSGDMIGLTCPDGGGPGNYWYFSDATGLIDLVPLGISWANDINNAGVVTGRSSADPAFLWQAPSGSLRLLPLLPAPHDDAGVGLALNESRQVAGYGVQTLTGPDHSRAFRFSDRRLNLLVAQPGPALSGGYGINENGDVVGNSGTESTPDATAWLWTERSRRVNLITLVDEPDFFGISSARDINDHGQIIARAITDEPYGSAIVLTPPGGPAN
jgi:uncharacterized membrane protein